MTPRRRAALVAWLDVAAYFVRVAGRGLAVAALVVSYVGTPGLV